MSDKEFLPAPFIVGTGRCGTTMLRLMLDAHPDLAIPPETHFIPQALEAHKESSDPHLSFLHAVMAAPFWRDNHLTAQSLRRRVSQIEPFDLGGALRAFYELYSESQGKKRWGDKTPPYLLHMSEIQQVLPEARFVHLIRDGRDMALSFRGMWFGPRSLEEAATRWVSWIEEARRQSSGLSGYLEVRFEDLVNDTETGLRQICELIALPYDESMLDYHRSSERRLNEMIQPHPARDGDRVISPEERKAIHSLTSSPPQPSRAGRWRREMTRDEQTRFEQIAGALLRELNYETLTGSSGPTQPRAVAPHEM